jgi:hypothetical protein
MKRMKALLKEKTNLRKDFKTTKELHMRTREQMATAMAR